MRQIELEKNFEINLALRLSCNASDCKATSKSYTGMKRNYTYKT